MSNFRKLIGKREKIGQRYRALLDAAVDMIWVQNMGSAVIEDANAATMNKLGYASSEIIGRPVFNFYYDPADRVRGVEFLREIRARAFASCHMVFRSKESRPIEVEMRGSLVRELDEDRILIIARDIGEEQRHGRTARTLEEAFRRSNDVMFYSDRNGIILDINEAFTRVYGYSRDEAIGQKPRILRSPHSTEELYRRMWSNILNPATGFWRGEIINRTKEGREIPMILTITAVRDGSGEITGYVSNAMDISEHVALRARVAQAEALASLGEMAAVVAHEIRNPLGSIVMAAKEIVSESLSPEDRNVVLQVLRNESRRLNEALTNFLAFAKPREIRLGRVDINQLLDEVVRMVRSNDGLLGRVNLKVRWDAGLEPFPMDGDQIRQVAWNIILNALQSLDGQGRLTIETIKKPAEAILRISDSGPGMTPDVLKNLFKPFLTTKRQGTGLGLAIAHRIIKAHGGRIEAESHPGEGAIFRVVLPIVEG
ncbi:MAG: PAS domain S-box protein [Elusimicrobia bacterium]|nr:PAS domain S-box protein [Elusimicrobiota bacterium]